MNPKTVRTIFLRFKKANPHPTTELIYYNPFQLLIAVMLSAQATDKSVNKACAPLFAKVKTPNEMLLLGEAKLKNSIKSIGLYLTKAKNVMATCKLLIENFNATVPNSRAELETLPGVGRKTANVILNTCFGQTTIAVDTHILRVANRIGLANGTKPVEIEHQLMKTIPNEFKHDAHHWLILHGRYICIARKPLCPKCLIRDLCEYPFKTL